MDVKFPEDDKQPGLSYAVDDDGLELPVIDVTHPAFALQLTEAAVSAAMDEGVKSIEAFAKAPPETLRKAMAGSRLFRATMQSAGGITSGMATYLLKLGPENLGRGWASDGDRRFAGGILPLSMRYRLRDVSLALADALVPALGAQAGRPLELVNIGGGPAMDSINALVRLGQEQPALLRDRQIRIQVLDVDEAGPRFGARSLAALREPGARLHGLAATLDYVHYDWSSPQRLHEVFATLADGAITAVSSEGGLFDYGSDDAILANLKALHQVAPAKCSVVGSVVRAGADDPRIERMARFRAQPSVRYLGLGAFRQLSSEAGWTIAGVINGPMHHAVTLKKA